jgi:hypothetical protein
MTFWFGEENKDSKAHKYNVHFGYKPGDPGFIVATTDSHGGGHRKTIGNEEEGWCPMVRYLAKLDC